MSIKDITAAMKRKSTSRDEMRAGDDDLIRC